GRPGDGAVAAQGVAPGCDGGAALEPAPAGREAGAGHAERHEGPADSVLPGAPGRADRVRGLADRQRPAQPDRPAAQPAGTQDRGAPEVNAPAACDPAG